MPKPRGQLTPFGRLLYDYIVRSGNNVRSFAAAVNTGASTVSQVAYGKRTPPVEDLSRWASVLRLEQSEAETWIEAGRSLRAKGKTDSAGYVSAVESDLQEAFAIASQFVSILEKERVKVPHDLKERLRALRQRWG